MNDFLLHTFYGEELLATRSTPKKENQLLSAFRECVFSIFLATLHNGILSSNLNLKSCRVVF